MKEDEELKTPTWVTNMREKIFSNDKLSKGEWIHIILTIILIVVIITAAYTTKCSLDCSMCEHTGQLITQRGF